MTDRIRAFRRARGWSQTELAQRAGVTRQLVSAVESGRHSPNVLAALSLARVLETSVEALFGPVAEDALDVLGAPVRPGMPILTARVGERLISVPVSYGVDSAESWGVADAVWGELTIDWLPGGTAAGMVIAGCDPIMGIIAGLVERSGHRVLSVHASTGRSVRALAAGRVHGVLVHSRKGDLPAPPVPVRRWHVASWQVGLASDRASGAPSIDELATKRLTVVQRDAGAGTQQALVRALRRTGVDQDLPGPVGDGHIDVARRVAYGTGEAGVVMEAAAIAFGLGFTALEQHVVEFWLAEEWIALPAAIALLDVLNSAALTQRSRLLGGYDPTDCGLEVLAS